MGQTRCMTSLPFTKVQAAGNDFLLVERTDLDRIGLSAADIPQLATDACDRRFGVGADGLEVLGPAVGEGALISAHLFNSDGSEAEISGNGTRCVAAWLTAFRKAPRHVRIETGAGMRDLELIWGDHPNYAFRMTTAEGEYTLIRPAIRLVAGGVEQTATLVDVGNPQCVCRVGSFDFDWRRVGSDIERHADLPTSTNVSFVRIVGEGTRDASLEVRFWERGAGQTLSSGTGSLGAAVAARHHGWITDRARIVTQGGEMTVDWLDGVRLTGNAAIVCRGTYFVQSGASRQCSRTRPRLQS